MSEAEKDDFCAASGDPKNMNARDDVTESRPETIYNLFVYIEGDTVAEVGVAAHEASGSDDEKASHLKSLVDSDYPSARRLRLAKPIESRDFDFMMRVGTQFQLFDDLLRGNEALWMITAIENGVPRIRRPGDSLDEQFGMVDYLGKYVNDGKFDIHRLINDDYFEPIKLLFNAQHYVSAAKLLMSAVDTIAFIAHGDVPRCFQLWLESYVDLTPLGITAGELWEFRNGLLHMSNMQSRAVLKGDVARLVMYIGEVPETSRPNTQQEKFFDLRQLIQQVALGLGEWVPASLSDRAKLLDFISRYDLTVSDARLIKGERR